MSSLVLFSLSDGVSRTGTFICIHAQLERLKTEGVVDFFQSIKSARIQRAGLVPDVVSARSTSALISVNCLQCYHTHLTATVHVLSQCGGGLS